MLLASTLAAAIAMPGVAIAQAGPAPEPTFAAEKCYGISKAGQNDCASTGNNSCAVPGPFRSTTYRETAAPVVIAQGMAATSFVHHARFG